MVDKKTGLGRGLTSLLGENLSESILEIEKNNNNIEIKNIPIEKIKPGPWQARKQFDKESIYELSESIISKGVINPIIITPTDGKNQNGYCHQLYGHLTPPMSENRSMCILGGSKHTVH